MIGKQVISLIAQRTGESSSTWGVAARALREARKDQWIQGVQGGRIPAYVLLHHLISLWLARAKNTTTQASSAAFALGSARVGSNDIFFPDAILNNSFSQDPKVIPEDVTRELLKCQSSMRSKSLLDAFCWFVNWLSELEGHMRRIVTSENDATGDESLTFSVTVRSSVISGDHVSLDFFYSYSAPKVYAAPLIKFHHWAPVGHDGHDVTVFDLNEMHPAAISEMRCYNTSFFLTLAECWTSTKQQLALAKVPSDSDPEGSGGEFRQEDEGPALPGEGPSTSKHPEDDAHPTAYRNGLSQRSDGRSLGGEKSRDARFRPTPLTPPIPGDPHATERRQLVRV